MSVAGSNQESHHLGSSDDLVGAKTCLTVNRFDVGAHANIGRRDYMEDTHTTIQDLCIESLNRWGLHPQSFFAVYDGHFGKEASSYLKEELHHIIVDTFSLTEAKMKALMKTPPRVLPYLVTSLLENAFEKTDMKFLDESTHPEAGSTATTVLIAGKYIFVSNVGDSRTVLCRAGKAERLSDDQKPKRPDEAQRIRNLGGFVTFDNYVRALRGPREVNVSRAFGDSVFKTYNAPKSPKEDADSKPRSGCSDYTGSLVIPTPEITITELTDDCEFVVLGSDGLYDDLTDQEVVKFIREKVAELGDVQQAVKAMVEYAIKYSHDNVTCVVVMFKKPQKQVE